MMNLDDLKKQLQATEQEFETTKAAMYRCDGVLQLLKHLIANYDEAPLSDDKPQEKVTEIGSNS